jgi:hypothetical protein
MKLRNDLVDNPEENLPFGNFKVSGQAPSIRQ